MIWLLRRIGISILLVWAVASIVYLAIHLVPGDPAELLLSSAGMTPNPEAIADLRQQLGLDRPMLDQYLTSLGGLVRGDLGVSLRDGTPVAEEIARRLPRTLELLGVAGLFAAIFGIPLGTFADLQRGRTLDRALSGIASLSLAVPVFVLGTLTVMLFALQLHWAPAGGFVPITQSLAQHLILLAMPALTIGIGLAAIVMRMTRASILDVMQRDFIRTARAKGVGAWRILVHHMLRNAMMPVVTVLALHLGSLLGGTVLVEYVFNWPGMSGFLVDAVNARDYPEVVGVILVISIIFVALNLIVDIVYGLLDPRVRR